MGLELPIYLDNNATTRVDPRVVEAILPYYTKMYGNSGSRNHQFGWDAEDAIKLARKQAAAVIGASSKEIIWTSGSTEANNLAIKGAAEMYAKAPYTAKTGRGHIVTCAIEHKAVLDPVKRLMRQGFDATFINPDTDGVVHHEQIEAVMRDDTILVSIMWANNEMGTINEVPEIGAMCHERGVVFHTDATQWVGKMPTDVYEQNIDLLSWSGHKIYGPMGVGALFVRRRRPRIRLVAQMDGGGQERGFRSGTINIPGVVGFGKACEICAADRDADTDRLRRLRDRLEKGILARLEEVFINGDPERRMPHVTNMSFGYVEGESLMMAFKDIAVSSGSACTSASLEPSYVLKGIGVGDELAHSSIRFSLGRWTTEAEIDYTIDKVVEAVEHLRAMSPLYDMFKEGIDISKIDWAAH